jgi:hypothetical protein
MIRVSVKVKLRAFGVTLGKVERAFVLGLKNGSPTATPIHPSLEPAETRVLVDEKGVRIAVW